MFFRPQRWACSKNSNKILYRVLLLVSLFLTNIVLLKVESFNFWFWSVCISFLDLTLDSSTLQTSLSHCPMPSHVVLLTISGWQRKIPMCVNIQQSLYINCTKQRGEKKHYVFFYIPLQFGCTVVGKYGAKCFLNVSFFFFSSSDVTASKMNELSLG